MEDKFSKFCRFSILLNICFGPLSIAKDDGCPDFINSQSASIWAAHRQNGLGSILQTIEPHNQSQFQNALNNSPDFESGTISTDINSPTQQGAQDGARAAGNALFPSAPMANGNNTGGARAYYSSGACLDAATNGATSPINPCGNQNACTPTGFTNTYTVKAGSKFWINTDGIVDGMNNPTNGGINLPPSTTSALPSDEEVGIPDSYSHVSCTYTWSTICSPVTNSTPGASGSGQINQQTSGSSQLVVPGNSD